MKKNDIQILQDPSATPLYVVVGFIDSQKSAPSCATNRRYRPYGSYSVTIFSLVASSIVFAASAAKAAALLGIGDAP